MSSTPSNNHAEIYKIKKPGFLSFLMTLFYGIVAIWVVVSIFIYFLAFIQIDAKFYIDDKAVSREEFLNLLPDILLIFLLVAVFLLILAEIIRREIWWSRELLLAICALMCIPPIFVPIFTEGIGTAISNFLFFGVFLFIAFWYFYKKKNVIDYYKYLKMK